MSPSPFLRTRYNKGAWGLITYYHLKGNKEKSVEDRILEDKDMYFAKNSDLKNNFTMPPAMDLQIEMFMI